MLNLKRDIKDIKRLEKILVVFFEEGLGHYLGKSKLTSHLPFIKRFSLNKKLSNNEEIAIRLRRSFEKLGPTFVKLGQLLSLRPDLVPVEFANEFSKLQDSVKPFPFSQAKKIIEKELGKPLNKVFKKFEKKPIASASIAQVHQATLKSGEKVAVKVQRPNIKETIDADLDILFFIAYSLQKHSKFLKIYNLVDIVKEFSFYTRRELDFNLEKRSAAKLRDQLKGNPKIKVPKIFPEYSSKKVLTMEFIGGTRFDDLEFIKKHNIDIKELTLTTFFSTLEQALFYGFFHADPHPANLFVQKDGVLVYLDFGIMGDLNKSDRKKILRFFTSIPERDAEKSFDILLSLAREIKSNDLKEFKKESIRILEEVYFHDVGESSIGKAIYDVISLGSKNGVRFDANHVLMAKAIYQGEGLMRKVHADFKISEGIERFTKDYIRKKYSLPEIKDKIEQSLWYTKDLIDDLPEHIQNIIKKLEQPEQPKVFDSKQLLMIEEDFEKMVSRKNFSLITSLLLISSMILFHMEGRTELFGIPLSIILFTLALLFLFYFVIRKI